MARSPLRVAVVGAGPAGIYAGGILTELVPGVRVDVIERLPTPYGLVRYGVSPDHPKIKKIIDSLHIMLDHPGVRLLGNVDVGTDVTVEELRAHYDAVILATGATRDVPFDVPGADLPGSFGAADFVSWYDSHPDVPRQWPLRARSVAVIGAGNVALDVTRMLIRHPRSLTHTDISDNVEAAFAKNTIEDIHVFARRGPVDVRFSPGELRELGELEDVDVIVDPADVVRDQHVERMTRQFAPRRLVMASFERWAQIPADERTAARRVHFHFYRAPAQVLGTDRVEGLRTQCTVPDGYGHVNPSDIYEDHPVQAVYRAVGYASSPVPGVPFDPVHRTVPHTRGAVLDSGEQVPGLYVTGWIKRGPVGLIGATKSDARETIETLLGDVQQRPAVSGRRARSVDALLAERGVQVVDWRGWTRIDAAERELGAARGRERTKIVDRDLMTRFGAGTTTTLVPAPLEAVEP
nr:FAD-dependent oxidoreductase [Cellulosimicrobium sp. TH-20]